MICELRRDVIGRLSVKRDVIVYEDSKCEWCVSLLFLSQWKRSFIVSQTAVVSVAWVRQVF